MVAVVGHGAEAADLFGIGTDPFPGLGISRADVLIALIGDQEIHREMQHLAEQVRDYWRSIAPVFDPGSSGRSTPGVGEPGDYRDSIHIEWVESGLESLPMARVISNDQKAVWIEFGSEHMPEHACAAKTAAHFGGTGPVYHPEIVSAHHRVREAVAALAGARRGGSHEDISLAQKHLSSARYSRSAAFKAQRQRASRKGRDARS